MRQLIPYMAMLILTGCAGTQFDDGYTQTALVNRDVNTRMTYRADTGDQWDATCPVAGDCEDYALCKARKLMEQGVATSRMQLWVLKSWRGDNHAVLVVDDVVLDNRVAMPVPVGDYDVAQSHYKCRLDGTGPANTKCRGAIAQLQRR